MGKIAVLIPCLNEEKTVGKVVIGFKKSEDFEYKLIDIHNKFLRQRGY